MALACRTTGSCMAANVRPARRMVAAGAFRLITAPRVTPWPGGRPSSSTAAPSTAAAPPLPVDGLASLASASASAEQQQQQDAKQGFTFHGVHHVALICENLERSLEFYQGVLGMSINADRPDDKLPYRGAWLWIGPEMIHLMELPNPDPSERAQRPAHGGRDRHFCIGVANLDALAAKLDAAGVPFTRSMSGRAAVFFRDPDANTLECVELEPWR